MKEDREKLHVFDNASSKEAYVEFQDKAGKWEEAYEENAQKLKQESVHERLQNHQQKMADI